MTEPFINAGAGMSYAERRDYLKNRTYMTEQPTTITNMDYFDWVEKYKPLPNHLTKVPDNEMFETYGKELKFVQSQPHNKVWTLMDGADDSDETFISSGIHFVNRLGYYVTEVAFEDDEIIQVF